MLGAPVGIAGIAAANFILTALFLDALPATASEFILLSPHRRSLLIMNSPAGVASIPIATHLAGIGLVVSPGVLAVASIALPAVGAASLLYYSLYHTRRSKALK